MYLQSFFSLYETHGCRCRDGRYLIQVRGSPSFRPTNPRPHNISSPSCSGNGTPRFMRKNKTRVCHRTTIWSKIVTPPCWGLNIVNGYRGRSFKVRRLYRRNLRLLFTCKSGVVDHVGSRSCGDGVVGGFRLVPNDKGKMVVPMTSLSVKNSP